MATQNAPLADAGHLLMATGVLTALVGGFVGLNEARPLLIIFSVLLLMGYGVAGHLLRQTGQVFLPYALPVTAGLAAVTLLLFATQLTGALSADVVLFFLAPLTALLLAFAAGPLVLHALVRAADLAPSRDTATASPAGLLLVSAVGPIWNAFLLIALLGAAASPGLNTTIVGASALASVAAIAAAYGARRGLAPRFVVAGATISFVASASYLVQFMSGNGVWGAAWFGRVFALTGLLAAALAVAIGAVNWVQIAHAPRAATVPPEWPGEPAGARESAHEGTAARERSS